MSLLDSKKINVDIVYISKRRLNWINVQAVLNEKEDVYVGLSHQWKITALMLRTSFMLGQEAGGSGWEYNKITFLPQHGCRPSAGTIK